MIKIIIFVFICIHTIERIYYTRKITNPLIINIFTDFIKKQTNVSSCEISSIDNLTFNKFDLLNLKLTKSKSNLTINEVTIEFSLNKWFEGRGLVF